MRRQVGVTCLWYHSPHLVFFKVAERLPEVHKRVLKDQ